MRNVFTGLLTAALLLGASVAAPAQAQTTEWRFISFLPKTNSFQAPIDAALQRIKERTNGRLVIKTFYAGELPYQMPQYLRILSEGKADMAMLPNQALEGAPLAAASSLPFLSPTGTLEEQHQISDSVDRQVEEKLLKSFNVRLVSRFWWPPQILFSTVPVKSVADFKSLKVRAVGRELTEALSKLGASSIGIDSAEVYQALGRKTVDGAITGATNFLDYKMYEVAKYAYTLPINYVENSIGVNGKSWSALPKDIQDIVTEEMGKADAAMDAITKNDAKSLKLLETDHGLTVNTPPAGERANIRKLMVPVWEGWASRNGADGQEALAVLYGVIGGVPK
jgi:TRAP-type transport system periplasmic protein